MAPERAAARSDLPSAAAGERVGRAGRSSAAGQAAGGHRGRLPDVVVAGGRAAGPGVLLPRAEVLFHRPAAGRARASAGARHRGRRRASTGGLARAPGAAGGGALDLVRRPFPHRGHAGLGGRPNLAGGRPPPGLGGGGARLAGVTGPRLRAGAPPAGGQPGVDGDLARPDPAPPPRSARPRRAVSPAAQHRFPLLLPGVVARCRRTRRGGRGGRGGERAPAAAEPVGRPGRPGHRGEPRQTVPRDAGPPAPVPGAAAAPPVRRGPRSALFDPSWPAAAPRAGAGRRAEPLVGDRRDRAPAVRRGDAAIPLLPGRRPRGCRAAHHLPRRQRSAGHGRDGHPRRRILLPLLRPRPPRRRHRLHRRLVP